MVFLHILGSKAALQQGKLRVVADFLVIGPGSGDFDPMPGTFSFPSQSPAPALKALRSCVRILAFNLAVFCVLQTGTGCVTIRTQEKPRTAGQAGTRPAGSELIVSAGDARVGEYVSSWKGFRTSSYWIEGKDGVVVIDTQFLLSAGEQMLDWVEQLTGKKVVLAIVLHPNPDKFNGTALFQRRGIRVITSAQVAALIPAVHELRKGWFLERFQPDYPVELPRPEVFGERTQELEVAGLKLVLHVLGKGCSDAHVVVEFDEQLFVGDLVTRGFHAWLELGHAREWIATLKELQDLEPALIRTGRGGTGDDSALDRQIRYLEDVLREVRARKPRKAPGGKVVPISDSQADGILNAMKARYPAYDYSLFLEKGIPALWKAEAR